ncbi:MAG: hypothetical protein IPK16_08055 [Anaerolineales bacterium]|nr:hypothetical protein [Anaerolineales bacterium]
MINQLGVQPIARAWQVELDTGLETGEAPFFGLGPQQSILPGHGRSHGAGPGRSGARRHIGSCGRCRRRQPTLVGGAPARPSAHAPLGSPGVIAAYTAPDPATHCATLTTYDTRRSVFRRRPAGLPPAFQPVVVSTTQAANTPLEMLPLAEAQTSMAFGRDGWVALTTVAAAVVLFALAFIA